LNHYPKGGYMRDEQTKPLHPLLQVFWKTEKLHEKIVMRVAKPLGFTRNEADILLFLSNNENFNTAMDIVRYRYISKALVSKSIAGLVSKGYLTAQEDPEDRRYVRLFITPQAKEAASALLASQREFMSILIGTVSPDESVVIQRVIKNGANKLDEYL
jgi:MarR family transcriptional regulator for hemolysin